MPNQYANLDSIFKALAHPTRRTVVQRLTRGPAAVSELAEPFDLALPSFLQHLGVLEACGIVESTKRGRVRTCRLTPRTLRSAERWLEAQRAVWDKRLDQLDDYLLKLDSEEGEP